MLPGWVVQANCKLCDRLSSLCCDFRRSTNQRLRPAPSSFLLSQFLYLRNSLDICNLWNITLPTIKGSALCQSHSYSPNFHFSGIASISNLLNIILFCSLPPSLPLEKIVQGSLSYKGGCWHDDSYKTSNRLLRLSKMIGIILAAVASGWDDWDFNIQVVMPQKRDYWDSPAGCLCFLLILFIQRPMRQQRTER